MAYDIYEPPPVRKARPVYLTPWGFTLTLIVGVPALWAAIWFWFRLIAAIGHAVGRIL